MYASSLDFPHCIMHAGTNFSPVIFPDRKDKQTDVCAFYYECNQHGHTSTHSPAIVSCYALLLLLERRLLQ